MRKFPWAIGLILLTAVFSGACDVTATDQRRELPQWWSQIDRVEGVNLPVLDTLDRFSLFVSHPSFHSNIQKMGWNTFRLPYEWDDYVLSNDVGSANSDLDPRKILLAHAHLEKLIDSLRIARTQPGAQSPQPTFLILDFHQYKFGALCGGVGMPRGIIESDGINAQDSNCIFKAFHRFWNSPAAKQQWYEFAAAILSGAAQIAEKNENWLHIGIEPINEPQFGFAESLFSDNPSRTLRNLYRFTHSGAVQDQVDQFLIPFYRDFIDHMFQHSDLKIFLSKSLMVFEPFVLDHLNISVQLGPLNLEVNTDGHYHGMQSLWDIADGSGGTTALHWIAAPHHYVGAMDEGFLSMMPSFARAQLSRYPNLFIDRQRIIDRFRWMQGRMAEAGMEMILGEWGTQEGLLNRRGRPGGYRTWIADSQGGITAHSRGALWWQYVHDLTAQENSFYLLHSKSSNGTSLPWEEQVLKCDGSFPIARIVFGRCPE